MSIIRVDNLKKSFVTKKGPLFRRKKERIKDANTMIDTSSFLVQTLSGVQNPPQVFPRFFLAISLAIPITYFLDIIRVHTLAISPLVPYGLELFIFLAASLLFPIGGVWLFNYIDRKCRILGNLHVH